MKPDILINGPVKQSVISSLLEALGENTGAGGHSLFLGQVRADEAGGRRVKAIEYSAYESMVNAEADNIRKSILAEFDDIKSIEFIHSVGVVNAGEISLLVLVSAEHRHQAMQACSKTVELIKSKLPVWKREIYEDNTHEWKQNYQS